MKTKKTFAKINIKSGMSRCHSVFYDWKAVEIKALTALVARLSLSEGWENETETLTVSFNPYIPIFKQTV